jgi:hypothetical protein
MKKRSFALWLVLALIAFGIMAGGCGGGGSGDAPNSPSGPANFDGSWYMTSGTMGYTGGASYPISGYMKIATISSTATSTVKDGELQIIYGGKQWGYGKEVINCTIISDNKLSFTSSHGYKWILEYLPHSGEAVLSVTGIYGGRDAYGNGRFSRVK